MQKQSKNWPGVQYPLKPIVLQIKADGFLVFLKTFSWETDLWVPLADFALKNEKLGREICIQMKID